MELINKQIFERYAPASIDVESDIFDSIYMWFEKSYKSLTFDLLGAEFAVTLRELAEKKEFGEEIVSEGILVRGVPMSQIVDTLHCFLVNDTLYHAIPSLDLRLTANGFGVVNSQLIAPASKDRVASLRMECLEQRDEAFDELVKALPGNSLTVGIKDSVHWKKITASLIWTDAEYVTYCKDAKIERSNKVRFADRAIIGLTENKMCSALSFDQMHDFYEYLRGNKDVDAWVENAIKMLYQCFAELYSDIKDKKQPYSYTGDELLVFMEDNIEHFAPYANSKLYSARHGDIFKTTLKDGCFYF